MLSALIYLIYFYGMILFFFGLDELPNLGINGYQTKPVRLPGIQKSRTVNIIMHVGINFLYSVPGMIFMKCHIKKSESWLVIRNIKKTEKKTDEPQSSGPLVCPSAHEKKKTQK